MLVALVGVLLVWVLLVTRCVLVSLLMRVFVTRGFSRLVVAILVGLGLLGGVLLQILAFACWCGWFLFTCCADSLVWLVCLFVWIAYFGGLRLRLVFARL